MYNSQYCIGDILYVRETFAIGTIVFWKSNRRSRCTEQLSKAHYRLIWQHAKQITTILYANCQASDSFFLAL